MELRCKVAPRDRQREREIRVPRRVHQSSAIKSMENVDAAFSICQRRTLVSVIERKWIRKQGEAKRKSNVGGAIGSIIRINIIQLSFIHSYPKNIYFHRFRRIE